MFRKRNEQSAPAKPSPQPTSEPTFPNIRQELAGELNAILDISYKTQVSAWIVKLTTFCGATQAPLHVPDRSVWVFFGAWVEEASTADARLSAAKIADFTAGWHESLPNLPEAVQYFLGWASPDKKERIYRGAFEACRHLDPALVVSPAGTVLDTWRFLGTELGLPMDMVARAKQAQDDHAKEVVGQLYADAARGDEATQLLMTGTELQVAGRLAEALELFERAANLGNGDAMVAAGHVAQLLERPSVARYWAETAANLGNAEGMHNMGALSQADGDLEAAASWYERAADAGNGRSFAALVQLAESRGDGAAARAWALKGAQADYPPCLQMHANFLIQDDWSNREKALPIMERAATLGHPDAMVQAGVLCHITGNDTQARYWLEQAEAAGQPHAARFMKEYGFR